MGVRAPSPPPGAPDYKGPPQVRPAPPPPPPPKRFAASEQLETVWNGTMGRQGASLTRGGGSALHPRNLAGY